MMSPLGAQPPARGSPEVGEVGETSRAPAGPGRPVPRTSASKGPGAGPAACRAGGAPGHNLNFWGGAIHRRRCLRLGRVAECDADNAVSV